MRQIFRRVVVPPLLIIALMFSTDIITGAEVINASFTKDPEIHLLFESKAVKPPPKVGESVVVMKDGTIYVGSSHMINGHWVKISNVRWPAPMALVLVPYIDVLMIYRPEVS